MNLLLMFIASFFAGILGSMGMGGGGILVIFLSISTNMPQTHIQGINLLFFIPIALISVIIYCKQHLIEWKKALPLAFFGVCFSFLGVFIANSINSDLLRHIFGFLLLIMGFKELFSKRKAD